MVACVPAWKPSIADMHMDLAFQAAVQGNSVLCCYVLDFLST